MKITKGIDYKVIQESDKSCRCKGAQCTCGLLYFIEIAKTGKKVFVGQERGSVGTYGNSTGYLRNMESTCLEEAYEMAYHANA